jgi:hypothetical protein
MATDPEVWVRFLVLPDFQSSGSGMESTVSTIEELLGRKSSGSGLENREYGHKDLSRDTLYLQKLALTSLTSDGRSV